MTTNDQIVVTDIQQFGWLPETQQSWIKLKIDDENSLQITFADEFPPTLKLCLQMLQGHVAEERRKAGLTVLETTYVDTVDRIEFAKDDLNQVAVIRTHFQRGGSQDTPLEKAHIRPTIEFLESVLGGFESLSNSPKQ